MTDKRTCTECDWDGSLADVLTALNPFSSGDTLQGCPRCKAVNTIVVACDEPACWEPADAGTPTPAGYRTTCSHHIPKILQPVKL